MGKRLRYVLAVSAALLISGGVFLGYYIKTLQPRLKERVIRALEERFDANVQLADLRFTFFPLARVDGTGLIIKHRQWDSDAHPLIRIQRFHAETDYTTLLDWRNRVDRVVLEGLEIHIPPRGNSVFKKGFEANQEVSSSDPGRDTTRLKFLIETIVADNAMVEIEPKKEGKNPLQFPIQKLTMRAVGPSQPMAFTAQLTNAKPPGLINSTGHFGPWQRDDPRATPVSGEYTFQNADLSVFNGIRGTLSSKGRYHGVLQQINVSGETDTPEFALKEGGAAVHLTANFHAVVDGTNGDTVLDPVDAKFGRSEFLCIGGVVQRPGEKGKTVQLDARTKHGRMEDILRLIVNGPAIVKGDVEFQSKILIPPGRQQVADKLTLDGQFHLSSATFTSEQAANRLRLLSDRASGISKRQEEMGPGEGRAVASDLAAKFRLSNGQVSLAHLAFQVPGAHILLDGSYNLNSAKIDMKGKFQMRATLSETQSGLKAILLKPVDPFFRKDGVGFEIPITVGGTRDHPVIGASAFHRTFTIH